MLGHGENPRPQVGAVPKIGWLWPAVVRSAAIYEVGACVALEEAIDGLEPQRMPTSTWRRAGIRGGGRLANGLNAANWRHVFVATAARRSAPACCCARRCGNMRGPHRCDSAAARRMEYLTQPRQRLFESFQRLSRAIPTGLFDNAGIDAVSAPHCFQRTRATPTISATLRWRVVATDLDSSQAVQFRRAGVSTTCRSPPRCRPPPCPDCSRRSRSRAGTTWTVP